GTDRLDVAAVLELPELDRAVFAGRGDHVRVKPPGDIGDGRGVAPKVEVFAAGLGFPDHKAIVTVAGGQQHAVGAELDGGDPLGMLLHLEHQRAVGRVVDAYDLAGAAQGDLAVIGADVGGQDGVIFLAHLEDPLAGLDVERDGQSQLSAAAAAHEQQVAVATETEYVNRPLGEGKHTDKVVIGRPVEQHLLVPAHGHERGPGAGGHGHNRPRPGLRNE